MLEAKLEKYELETISMPFQDCLLGNQRIASYSFTHSFSTTLGVQACEQITKMIANANPELHLSSINKN